MMAEMHSRPDPWAEDDELARRPIQPLSRDQAQELINRQPRVSPWRVVGWQAVVGVAVAMLAWAVSGQLNVMWSALYGAAAVVVPGALMARGMTSNFSSMNAGVSAVSFMVWEMVKIAVSVAMLIMATRVVESLSWPALLVALVICIKVYWVALSWRRT